MTPFLCIIISLSFCLKRKRINFHAGVAQLVEHHLAKVDVEGSNPFARSIFLFVGKKPRNFISQLRHANSDITSFVFA